MINTPNCRKLAAPTLTVVPVIVTAFAPHIHRVKTMVSQRQPHKQRSVEIKVVPARRSQQYRDWRSTCAKRCSNMPMVLRWLASRHSSKQSHRVQLPLQKTAGAAGRSCRRT